ncbi:MAG TPA: enoyl-CoA hydratase-related protein [Pyrinomonadaceae bacterium]|nr:enoyl-CoA hydratase-related protein [Pyrinomonadaceae bacterium]
MSFETVIYEKDGNVSVLTMNRPEALNALSLQLTEDLESAIRKAIKDGARAVVLTANGRAFCSGGDLREMKAMWENEGRIEAFLEDPLAALHGVIRLIREAPIPFVAAVNGICAGAGTNFALACDLVVAADDATFNEAFVKIGLTPDCGGSFFLPRAVGEKLAAELFMTGESVSAERAAQFGMINRVVPAEDLLVDVLMLAKKLAQAPTAAIGRIKKLLNASYSNTLEQQLALEHELQIESGRGDDFREGVAAFFEKRPPNFAGS